MSIRNILKSLCVMFFGGLIGYSSVKYALEKNSEQNRYLASLPITKLGEQQLAYSLFEVKINSKEIAQTDSEITVLKINLKAVQSIPDGLIYNWILPQDVNVISGSISSTVGALTKGESKVFEIAVKGFSKQTRKYVNFEIRGVVNQLPVRYDALLSSRIEDSLEYLVHESEKQKQSELKIQKLQNRSKSKFDLENVVR